MHIQFDSPTVALCRQAFLDLGTPAKRRTLKALSERFGVSVHYLQKISSVERWTTAREEKAKEILTSPAPNVALSVSRAITYSDTALETMVRLVGELEATAKDSTLDARDRSAKVKSLSAAVTAWKEVHTCARGAVVNLGALVKGNGGGILPAENPALPVGGGDEPESDALMFDEPEF